MDIQTKTDIIHQKIYDFLLYIYPLLTKYPKYEKFSLQTATRNAILEMLQEVIKWDKTATKSHLYTVDTALQESKELLRLAHDLKSYTTYHIWKRYPNYLRKHFWKEHTFWTDGYFACSVGNVSEEMLKKYIENQG